MDLEHLTLLDVIDKGTLQSLQDAFANATGMAALATDDTGAVTHLSNPTEFCMKYTRKSAVGSDRCNKCDLRGGEEASRTGKPSVYYCHGGLVDFAAPIVVNGKHIGSLIGGQVLTEAPDEEKFRKIAAEIGVDPDSYIAALRKVPIVPKEKVDAAAELLYQIATALSAAGYQHALTLEKMKLDHAEADRLGSSVDEIVGRIGDVDKSIKALENSFASIKESAASSAKAVDNTDSIVKTIENASTQLTLIGFNASIEAKRAGAAGAGFNVIAQEVRTLADKNTKQAGEIENTLNGIKKAMNDINNQIKSVYAGIERTAAEIESLSAVVKDVAAAK